MQGQVHSTLNVGGKGAWERPVTEGSPAGDGDASRGRRVGSRGRRVVFSKLADRQVAGRMIACGFVVGPKPP